MKKSTTIKDIASRLGLSASTVSRALSGMPGVDPLTREAVEDLAKELNYQPNLTAVRQVRKQSHIIGVVIPSFTIYFYAEALSGMQDAAEQQGYNLMICQTTESYEQEKKAIDLLLSSRMDGLIASISRETTQFDHLEKVINRGMPVVLFNRVCEIDACKVVVNDFDGGYQATAHLVSQGAKRIGHISGPQNLQISTERLGGFRKALEEARIGWDESLVVESDFTFQSGYDCARAMMQNDRPPDAIFGVCDEVAYGVLEFARDHQIDVPDQLQIVGFTDEPHSTRLRPRLTTIHQPILEIGQVSVDLLIEQLKNPHAKREHRIIPTDLRVRGSTFQPS